MEKMNLQQLKLLVAQLVYFKSATGAEYYEEQSGRSKARRALVDFCSDYNEEVIKRVISDCPGSHMITDYDWKEIRFDNEEKVF